MIEKPGVFYKKDENILTERILKCVYPIAYKIAYVSAFILAAIIGIWGMALVLDIAYTQANFWGFCIAFLLFPLALIILPWFDALVNQDLKALAVVYGGAIIIAALFYLLKEAKKESRVQGIKKKGG